MKYYMCLWIVAFLSLGIMACSDSVLLDVTEETTIIEGDFYLNIVLKMADGEKSRADDSETPIMPGYENENKINTLDVFLKEGKTWKVIKLNGELLVDKEVTAKIPLSEPLTDDVQIFVGGNLNDNQIAAFQNNNSPYSLVYDQDDLVNDLSPYSIGYDSDPGQQGGIAMFCTEAVKPVQDETDTNIYTASFSLKRLVAKILLTCSASNSIVGEEGVHYAVLSGDDPTFAGWIRLDNIWYIVNSRNRSTYIMQKLLDGNDTDANVEDSNMELASYINAAENYATLVRSNFSYIGRSQYRNKPHFCKSLIYDEKRMDAGSANPYIEGIYSPENTFSFNELTNDEETNLKKFENAWGMITHLSIMAKFTPRKLYVEYGLFDFVKEYGTEFYSEEMKQAIENLRPTLTGSDNPSNEDIFLIDCKEEKVAQAILTASLRYKGMYSPGSEEKYPEETFFLHKESNGNAYYTYGAACIKYNSFSPDNPKDLGNYIPHLTGWGYYYTYIDNRSEDKKTDTNPFTFYKHGQVERNRYYILNIRSFSGPGSSIVGSDYIEVNTQTRDWIQGGDGSITLE